MFRRAIIILLFLVSMCYAPEIKPPRGSVLSHSNPYGISPPVALWPFNEGSGNLVNDLSENKYIGTLIGDAHFVPGKFGPALHFDGTGDWAKILGSPVVDEPLTLLAWFKPAKTTGTQCIVGIGTTDTGADGDTYFSLFQDGDSIQALKRDGTANVGSSAGTSNILVANNWYQIVAVFESNTSRKIYVNGALEDVDTTDIGDGSTTIDIVSFAELFIKNGTSDQKFTGVIDHGMIFKGILTASQIAQLSIVPFPWFRRDPIELWVTEEAPPPEGQVIFINFASMGYGASGFGLILVMAIIRKLRNRKRRNL